MSDRYASRLRVRRWALRVLVTCAVAFSAAGLFAQDATEPALKGALIFNFARFTSWPDDALPPNAGFVACVVGDRAVSQALERTVKDRLLDGHRITVSHPDVQQSMRPCHLLYVTGLGSAQLARMIGEVRGSPVLTIVDVEGSSAQVGIARVFIENGRIRFELDRGLAKHSRLQLSSQLLAVASRVFDDPAESRRTGGNQ